MTRDINEEISAKEELIRPEHRAIEYINNEQVNVQLEMNHIDQHTNQMNNSKDLTPRVKRKKARKNHNRPNAANTKVYKEIKMPNGILFKGLSTKKNPLSGEGQLIYPDGSLYIGQIKNGQSHGHGEKILSQLKVLNIKGLTTN